MKYPNPTPQSTDRFGTSGDVLAAMITSVDCGTMMNIDRTDQYGVYWSARTSDHWFVTWESINELISGGDGLSTIRWFFGGTFLDRSEARSFVMVYPEIMTNIQHLRTLRLD
jgi:hypothetical protein